MATTGAKFPTTAANVSATPWIDDSWVNPTNVTAAGSVYATITAATYDAGDQSHKLRATGFDFSAIANGDTIDGIVVIVGGASYQAGTASIDLVQLVNAGTPIGDNKRATPVAVTASDANYTQGGSTDKWNATLTPAVVKSSTFGVDVGMIANSANTDVRIDYVTIEVYYTFVPVTHASSGTLSAGSATASGTSARVGSHPSSGALTAGSATIAGTAARVSGTAVGFQSILSMDLGGAGTVTATTHASSGALSAGAATVAGTGARTRLHESSGTPTATAATLAGTAARTRLHESSGAVAATAAAIAGTSARMRLHESAGALTAGAATVSGDAAQATGAVTHESSGALAADSATAAGTAARTKLHDSSGTLAAGSATTAGTATRATLRDSSGALAAQAATIAGTAARIAVHASSGALSADAASIAGTAARSGAVLVGFHSVLSMDVGGAGVLFERTSSGTLTAQSATVSGDAAVVTAA